MTMDDFYITNLESSLVHLGCLSRIYEMIKPNEMQS